MIIKSHAIGLSESGVYYAIKPNASAFNGFTELVMNVRNTMSQQNTPSDTTSAETAEEVILSPQFMLDPSLGPESLSAKCASKECDGKVTPHEWAFLKVIAASDGMIDAMHSKRILMCTVCGKVSVKQ